MAKKEMARFFKPRQLPAVVWNPASGGPLFEFSPDGFCDTDDPAVIEYMEKAGYRRLSAAEVLESDKFIAEQMKLRGEDQSGFVQPVPPPDGSETNPEAFEPVGAAAAPVVEGEADGKPIADVHAVQGGEAASSVPPLPADIGDDDDTVASETTAPPAPKTKKVAKKKAIKRRTPKAKPAAKKKE